MIELPNIKMKRNVKSNLKQNFEKFHEDNPHVYDSIVSVARELKGMGFRRSGIGFIYERLRWLHAMKTRSDTFKLCNNHRAFYARLVMQQEPDLQGFFKTKRQESEE